MVDSLEKIFNNQTYLFDIKITNPDGKEFQLNPEAVLQLVIEDNIHFFPFKGFFIYENSYEMIEKGLGSSQLTELQKSTPATEREKIKKEEPYLFRNDGKDYITILIKPTLNSISELIAKGAPKELPPEIWNIKLEAVIYDQEDIEVGNITQKCKKYYFWDKRFQQMLEKNVEWSTATSKYNESYLNLGKKYKPSQASDEQRKMLTGQAIKALLKENGFENDITTDSELFDKGSTKIFFNSPNNYTMVDILKYLLNAHVSEKNTFNTKDTDEVDICLFNLDRYTQKFELIPLWKYFKNAGSQPNKPGKWQIEYLLFDEMGNTNISSMKSPHNTNPNYVTDNLVTKIKTYQFVDMSAADNLNNIVTTPVYSYDFKNKKHLINVEKSNISILSDKIKGIYLDNKIYAKGNYPLLTLNQNKINNTRINPTFSLRNDVESMYKHGIGKLLNSALFLNTCVVLKLDGATFRQSGRFVGIDRLTDSDNNLDYKLCGQWFITTVKHVFFQNMYQTEVTAIKPHSYENLNLKQDV